MKKISILAVVVLASVMSYAQHQVNSFFDDMGIVGLETQELQESSDTLINMTNTLIGRFPLYDSWWDSMSAILSPIASAVTILGIVTLWISLRKRYINREWRKLMVLDLIRHFFMTNSILEAIRVKLSDDLRPQEGIIARISTLDEDVNLNRFSTSKRYYEVCYRN